MKYFIVEYTYLKPLEDILDVVQEHRRHLDEGYEKGWFLASGPQNPKDGGLLVARSPDRADLEEFLARDPFVLKGAAKPRVIEFDPVKRHPKMAQFFEA